MCEIENKFFIYRPIKAKNNFYYSKVLYNESDLTFQPPKSSILLQKDKNRAKILLDEETAEFVKNVSTNVINITSEKSEDFFGKSINVEDCSSIYKEALNSENYINCFYDEDLIVFDSKKNHLDVEKLDDTFEGICILKCECVIYTKTSFYIRWEISQIKVKTNKSKDNKDLVLTDYSILDLPEHAEPIDGDPLVKKLEEICLF